jgi:hypothetical protein
MTDLDPLNPHGDLFMRARKRLPLLIAAIFGPPIVRRID